MNKTKLALLLAFVMCSAQATRVVFRKNVTGDLCDIQYQSTATEDLENYVTDIIGDPRCFNLAENECARLLLGVNALKNEDDVQNFFVRYF